jgi:hypothetical protein
MEFFDKAKQAMYQETVFANTSKVKDYDPEKLALNPGAAPKLQPIFDALEINNRCCRIRMMTVMAFDQMYTG